MGTQLRCWRVYCVLVVLFGLCTITPALGADYSIGLSHTNEDASTGLTSYHYVLQVSSQSILTVGQSQLTMSGLAPVHTQGAGNYWANASVDDSAVRWLFVGGTPTKPLYPFITTFAYFDIIVDTSTTETGTITTCLDGSCTTVDGPVPTAADISGTVYLDNDVSGGLYEDAVDTILSGVTVELRDADGNLVAATVADVAIIDADVYIGNYVFRDVPFGDYSVSVPATFGDLSATTATEQSVSLVWESIRQIDFGYAVDEAVEVEATVFFDANKNGLFDEGELTFEEIGVTLTPGTTLSTNGDGFVGFGEQDNGGFSIAVTDGGSYGLLDFWTTTTGSSFDFAIDSDTESPVEFFFGYYPDPSSFTGIVGMNHTIGFWKNNIAKAQAGKTNGVQVSAADLQAWLAEVENLGPFDEPYDLSPDRFEAALWYLTNASGNSPVARLERQLLAGELNYVSGFSSNMPGLEYAMIWWAEYVINEEPAMAGELAELIDWWNNLGNR
ncbi:MAG: hypothetical protein GX131_02505 [candidate division WS1 bacterium]|nr:hypothetical protein [candidate division WS1 bacterium]